MGYSRPPGGVAPGRPQDWRQASIARRASERMSQQPVVVSNTDNGDRQNIRANLPARTTSSLKSPNSLPVPNPLVTTLDGGRQTVGSSTFIGGVSNETAYAMLLDEGNYLYIRGCTSAAHRPFRNSRDRLPAG